LDLNLNKNLTSVAAAQAAGVQVITQNLGHFSCSTPGQCANASVPLIDTVKLNGFGTSAFNGLEFNLDLSLETLLSSDVNVLGVPTAPDLTANDLITFVVLDANGQVIPGVTFVTDDGFVFGGPEAATPVPG